MTDVGTPAPVPHSEKTEHAENPAAEISWARTRARLAVRRTRERARSLAGRTQTPPTRRAPTVRVADCELRPLARSDQQSWSASMRANAARMGPWWGIDDWAAATDHIAFAAHYTQWARQARAGTGLALAMCTPDAGVIGELQVWHIDPGAGTAELGVWAAPNTVSARVMLPLLAGGVDYLFECCGLVRFDSPVAAGNLAPRKLLEAANFVNEGTLSQWRRVRGEMTDFDMYGLTPERWAVGRSRLYRLNPWEPLLRPLA